MKGKWLDRWMDLADLAATWSDDRSRKTGCVIVDSRNAVIAVGWNGFPRGVKDTEQRHERPAKYYWTEHAERNAIYDAAAKGISTAGGRMYLSWYPCADCARAIVQAGIYELVCVEPDWKDVRWANDFEVVKQMLSEAEVRCAFVSNRWGPIMATQDVEQRKLGVQIN